MKKTVTTLFISWVMLSPYADANETTAFDLNIEQELHTQLLENMTQIKFATPSDDIANLINQPGAALLTEQTASDVNVSLPSKQYTATFSD